MSGDSGPVEDGADVAAIRTAIERTDRALVGLVAERVRLSRSVHAAKQARGLPVCDPAREAAVLRSVAAAARDENLDPEVVRQLFWCIIGMCRSEQLEGRADA